MPAFASGLFGLRHSPSYLLDVASLHEPGVGAVCFVQVLAKTSAYRNEVYLLPKQLDVKVTSYTFSTRHGAQAFLLKNTPGHPEQFFISSTAPLLMENLPTHAFVGNARHVLYSCSFRELGHAGHFRTSPHQRDGEFILVCQRGHVRLKAPVQRFNNGFCESFPFHPISSSWSTWNFHDVRWRTEVFHFLVMLAHLEIHGVQNAGAMLHVQEGYSQC